MSTSMPEAALDQRYSSPDAVATDWNTGRKRFEESEIYWVVTVRPDGRPNVAPLIAVSLDGAFYFSTGVEERKARNLAENAHCLLLTGTNTWDAGLDVVVEGDARMVTDDARLQLIADAYLAKYGEAWRYTVHDGALYHGEGHAAGDHGARVLTYEIVPETAFGFGRGAGFSQTRWRF